MGVGAVAPFHTRTRALPARSLHAAAVPPPRFARRPFFYTLTNPVTQWPNPNGCSQRNQVNLARSSNLRDWQFCAVVLWDDTGLPVADSIKHTGLQYLDWQFNHTDIVTAVRAGYRGSSTYHDANRLLTTTVHNYASLCSGPAIRGSGFAMGVLVDGQAAFTNREYVWAGVPDALRGLMFTRKAGGLAAANISLAVPASQRVAVTAYLGLCVNQTGHAPPRFTGWQPANMSFVYTDTDSTKVTIFQRHISPGTAVTVGVPHDPTWCGSIVMYAPGAEAGW